MPDRKNNLSNLEEAFAGCMKCGFCKAVCPVFIGKETTTPRAKVRLARAAARGELTLSAGVKKQMDRCLNCMACAKECPSGVEPNKIALALRDAYVRRDGLPLVKKAIFRGGLPNPRLMAWGLGAMGIGQHLTAIELQNNPLRGFLPLLGMRKDKDLPLLGRKSLFARLPESLEPYGELRATVLYFPGCGTNFIYPEIGLATVEVLRKLGARVILPHDMVCCGTPVFNSGDIAGARDLARRNIGIFKGHEVDAILTACGSCGNTIKNEWKEVLGLDEADMVAGKVMDISQFVVKYALEGALKPLDNVELTTYHDSCHLRRGMGVWEEPRAILRTILGENYVEMEQADRCCGGGGAFSIYNPELSQTVADTKMECLEKSGARVVATDCPACMMQLQDSIVHRKMSQKVVHIIDLINRALPPGE